MLSVEVLNFCLLLKNGKIGGFLLASGISVAELLDAIKCAELMMLAHIL
jgi:hypothetical protein